MAFYRVSRPMGLDQDAGRFAPRGTGDLEVSWGQLLESAGPGPASLTAQGNSYTFTIVDSGNLIAADIEARIATCAHYVIDLISHYVAWQGTLDFTVNIHPKSESPYPDVDGIATAVAQLAWNGTGFDNQTISEARTGTDSDPARPDAGCDIYLAADGTIRAYGTPMWFDPNPQFGVNAGLPAGMDDFVGIYTHEVFHSLGFYPGTVQWQQHIQTSNGMDYFSGTNVNALFGGPLPFITGSGHYGNLAMPEIPISRGLMFQYGNYDRNRFDIGRIDLAVLADLGHTIKTYDGLPVFELIDTQPDLTGTAAIDTMYGDYHGNTLRGMEDNDSLFGGGGADYLVGGPGNDIMVGSTGDDTYYVDSTSDAISEYAGQGYDRIAATITLALAADADIERIEIENLTSTNALDITGSAIANVIYGNDGQNILRGEAGNDELRGFGGNDFLVGGPGTDLMVGGLGDDTFYVDDASDAIGEIAGQGNDRIAASVSFVLSNGADVELLEAVNIASTTAFDLTGSDSANTVTGNAGVNILRGEGGNDILSGAGGDDFLVGGAGNDTMNGGTGNDTYYVDAIGDVINEFAGEGSNDRVATSITWTLAANADVELLEVADKAGTAAINLTGNSINNTIGGNEGANIIDGKLGNDLLIGYGGADSFAFTTALSFANSDQIANFVTGTDKILLDDAVFAGIGPVGALNASAFYAGTAAHDADDRIIFDVTGGFLRLFFDADGNGAGQSVQFATLGVGQVTASDFMVI